LKTLRDDILQQGELVRKMIVKCCPVYSGTFRDVINGDFLESLLGKELSADLRQLESIS
jgi:hypothetical protein